MGMQMTTVYRYNRPQAFAEAALRVTDMSMTLTFKLPLVTEADDVEPQPKVTINLGLDELKALPEFDDGAMLTFNARDLTPESQIRWKNLYRGTVQTRRPPLEYANELGWNTVFRILVPTTGITSLHQCAFIVQMSADAVLECVDPVTVLDTPNFIGLQFVPEIVGPTKLAANAGVGHYEVRLKDCNGIPVAASGQVFLEATAGTLNRARASLVQGVGGFDLMLAGMQAGETIKLKAGFRYFTGAHELIVTLT